MSSHCQNILGFLLKIEVRVKQKSASVERTCLRFDLRSWLFTKAFYQCFTQESSLVLGSICAIDVRVSFCVYSAYTERKNVAYLGVNFFFFLISEESSTINQVFFFL